MWFDANTYVKSNFFIYWALSEEQDPELLVLSDCLSTPTAGGNRSLG